MAKVLYGLCMVAVACALLVGCVQVPFRPPVGVVYTDVKAPLTTKFKSTPVCSEKGESSAEMIMCCIYPTLSFSWGDCDVDKAAYAGGLSKVEYADYEYMSVLSCYYKTTVTAYGK